ncbi:hypothetical protein H2200_003675 [Cladophialophora chaetospira]|uniref:Uncharacterized protein n=1 Tax=Cladophialophora chaetospira TaxID=386627 RepID=A0AA39CKY2_9EURO|nr:hypothetical protein H2200_003675 [Cladophialophora chaetospira]
MESETPLAGVSEASTPDQRTQGHGQPSSKATPIFIPSESSGQGLNMHHLELLHQFVSSTYTTFSPDKSVHHVWQGPVIRMALSHPFLMYEILAISALHLAYSRPANSTWYYTRSTELQSQALKLFNSVQRAVDASNCGPVLMFSSLLGLHVLADPSRTIGLNSHQYLDHVIHCIMLMRNVQKLIIHDWYDALRESELKPIFDVWQPPKPYHVPQPCLNLVQLTENWNVGVEVKEAYDQAIERLHWTYAVSKVPNENHTTVRWLLAWPIQLPEAYQEHLDQRRPEALVILAYFAVVLIFYKNCWIVGDSGQFLIKAIASHLGPHWAQWMKWPLTFVKNPTTGDT